MPNFPDLEDFKIRREIGRGGMGVVYQAEQKSLGRTVALKILPDHMTSQSRHVERFRREASAAARMQHPNIVSVHAVGEEQGIHYIAMDFVEGQTLDKVLANMRDAPRDRYLDVLANCVGRPKSGSRPGDRPSGALPSLGSSGTAVAVGIALRVAQGLAFAHEQGVVHRDVKPANVIVDASGTPMILDFGLSKDLNSASLSVTGDLLGTPQYMSPEQILGEWGDLDRRTDIYSLGVTLYELLSLELPFVGQSVQELIRKITVKEPIPLRKRSPSVPRDLETIVMTAMEKDPDRRYQNAQELADDLLRFLELRPIAARPLGLTSRVMRLVRRNPAPATAMTLGALIVVGAPVSYGWMEAQNASRLQGLVHDAEVARTAAQESEKQARDEAANAQRANAEAEREKAAKDEANKQLAEKLDELSKLNEAQEKLIKLWRRERRNRDYGPPGNPLPPPKPKRKEKPPPPSIETSALLRTAQSIDPQRLLDLLDGAAPAAPETFADPAGRPRLRPAPSKTTVTPLIYIARALAYEKLGETELAFRNRVAAWANFQGKEGAVGRVTLEEIATHAMRTRRAPIAHAASHAILSKIEEAGAKAARLEYIAGLDVLFGRLAAAGSSFVQVSELGDSPRLHAKAALGVAWINMLSGDFAAAHALGLRSRRLVTLHRFVKGGLARTLGDHRGALAELPPRSDGLQEFVRPSLADQRGRALIDVGELTRGFAALDESLLGLHKLGVWQAEARSLLLHMRLAALHEDWTRFDSADKSLFELLAAVANHPDSTAFIWGRGNVLAATDRTLEAAAESYRLALQTSVRLRQTRAKKDLMYALARLALRRRRAPDAVEHLEALRAACGASPTIVERGQLLRIAAGVKAIGNVAELRPDDLADDLGTAARIFGEIGERFEQADCHVATIEVFAAAGDRDAVIARLPRADRAIRACEIRVRNCLPDLEGFAALFRLTDRLKNAVLPLAAGADSKSLEILHGVVDLWHWAEGYRRIAIGSHGVPVDQTADLVKSRTLDTAVRHEVRRQRTLANRGPRPTTRSGIEYLRSLDAGAAKLRTAERELVRARRRIGVRSGLGPPAGGTLRIVGDRLGGSGVILDYVFGSEFLHVFVLTEARVEHVRLGRHTDIADAVAGLQNLWKESGTESSALDDSLERVGGMLLSPALRGRGGIEKVWVVAPRSLSAVPFAGLRVRDGESESAVRYAVERSAFSRLIAATALSGARVAVAGPATSIPTGTARAVAIRQMGRLRSGAVRLESPISAASGRPRDTVLRLSAGDGHESGLNLHEARSLHTVGDTVLVREASGSFDWSHARLWGRAFIEGGFRQVIVPRQPRPKGEHSMSDDVWRRIVSGTDAAEALQQTRRDAIKRGDSVRQWANLLLYDGSIKTE